ncbi:MAG: ADP-ribosylglycohydrolase family protein [Desulfuromonadales bacterium]
MHEMIPNDAHPARCRADAALRMLFVADALAMPVHWYYNPLDIDRDFPGGVRSMAAAPDRHPSSIMALHSVSHGGRKAGVAGERQRQVVGKVILKGKAQFWGQPNRHYHHRMQAGENTLNAHCARLLLRTLSASAGIYRKDRFLDAYIDFMTADPPRHPDTYAESYHRGFFANLINGKPKDRCGAVTHDTASVGGLVTIAPIVIAARLQGTPLDEVQAICREHLFLTHPDDSLARVCGNYVALLDALLWRDEQQPAGRLLLECAETSLGLNLESLVANAGDDLDVVGRRFSSACYISESWPSLLYLTYKYLDRPKQALIVNTNLGGDNVHRGAVMGVLLGLAAGQTVVELFDQLADRQKIEAEINALLSAVTAA